MRQPQVLPRQQAVFRDAGHRLQVLPRLRELQLPGLHHREVLRQWTGVNIIIFIHHVFNESV